jgi:membrane protein implicated in regulation of membrane protease activity
MEVNVAEPRTVDEIVAACEQYWETTKVPASTVVDMKAELQSHLHEAIGAGKAPSAVIGRRVTDFAEAWASEYRLPPPLNPPQSPEARRQQRKGDIVYAYGWMIPIAVAVVVLIIVGPKEDTVDDPSTWRWIWVGLTLFLGVGEMLTAGFFMLPFAAGALVAAILAWFNVVVWVQFMAFLVTSLVALWALRRFATSDHEPSYAVGAKRFVGADALVIELIDPNQGTGKVRMDTEEWRATTNGGIIDRGTPVKVIEVRGTRLVVEPAGTA